MCLWGEWLCAIRLYSREQFHTVNMCSNWKNTVASVSLFLLALCLNLALNQTHALLYECKLKDAVFLLPQTPEKLLKRTTCSRVFWAFRGVQLVCSQCSLYVTLHLYIFFLVTFYRKVKSKKRCPRTEWAVVWNNTPFPFWANSTIVLYCSHSSAVIRWPAYWIICFLIALVLAEGKLAEQETFFERLNLRPSSMKYLELLLLCH